MLRLYKKLRTPISEQDNIVIIESNITDDLSL